MIFRKLFFILFLLITGFVARAQSAATIKATLDKNKILIGEQATLRIEVQIPEKEPIRFVQLDSLAHFEWIGKPLIDTSSTGNGTLLSGQFTITSFDSGHWVIPPFELSGGLKTDSIPVDVVFSDFDPKAPYHEIKDILEADPEKKKNEWWWYAVAGGFLLVLILVLIFRRKKKPIPVVSTEPTIAPLDEALTALKKLAADNPEAKPYHTRLADIFRMYIYRKKGILSLQETTAELVLQISELGLPKDVQDELAQALRLGDFVKFAKFVPSNEENEKALLVIKRSIERIEQLN
jgi:LPXTG-motif cell wall-anchored protein